MKLPLVQIALFLLLFATGVLLCFRFADGDRGHGPPVTIATAEVPFSLLDQAGGTVTGETLRGRPWAACVFFTRCPSICAQMTLRLRELQEATDPSLRLVSFTTDPEHDTPEVLDRYARRFGADPERWLFLTGDPGQIATVLRHRLLLAAVENPEESRESPMDLYTHSTQVVLMDAEGRLRGTYEAFSTNFVESVRSDLEDLGP